MRPIRERDLTHRRSIDRQYPWRDRPLDVNRPVIAEGARHFFAAAAEITTPLAQAGARGLKDAVHAFLKQPSEHAMKAARQSWLDARVPYLQTEAFRFYDGPIDQVEGLVNAWPLDENYVDYVQDNPSAGIINAVEQ